MNGVSQMAAVVMEGVYAIARSPAIRVTGVAVAKLPKIRRVVINKESPEELTKGQVIDLQSDFLSGIIDDSK